MTPRKGRVSSLDSEGRVSGGLLSPQAVEEARGLVSRVRGDLWRYLMESEMEVRGPSHGSSECRLVWNHSGGMR